MPLTSFQLNCLFYMYLCLCTVTWVMLMVCFLCRIGLRSATPKLNVRKRSTWILLKGCTDTHEAHQTTAHSARCRARRPTVQSDLPSARVRWTLCGFLASRISLRRSTYLGLSKNYIIDYHEIGEWRHIMKLFFVLCASKQSTRADYDLAA